MEERQLTITPIMYNSKTNKIMDFTNLSCTFLTDGDTQITKYYFGRSTIEIKSNKDDHYKPGKEEILIILEKNPIKRGINSFLSFNKLLTLFISTSKNRWNRTTINNRINVITNRLHNIIASYTDDAV